MKKILSLLLLSSSLFSMELQIVPAHQKQKKTFIDKSSVFVPERLGTLNLSHGKKGFMIHQDTKKFVIDQRFLNQTARALTKENMSSFLQNGYFEVNQTNDGTFSLKATHRKEGGGAFGAALGAFLGKAAVYVLGHGAIQVVAICTGPAYPVTLLALEGCLAWPIEAASMAGAVAGGIALGVATGPV